MNTFMIRYSLILILTLISTTGVKADAWLFYQPQLRDKQIAEERWQSMMQDVRQRGFHTLVVQWTRFGSAFIKPEDGDWLQNRLEQAHAAGLELVVGLYADPIFFDQQLRATGYLGIYLDQLNQHNLSAAREWMDRLGKEKISGWYLSSEFDDANWRSPERQGLAKRYLVNSQRDLSKIHPLPVYVTSFFTGKMSPEAYLEMLHNLSAPGIKLWVQTGEGTGVLTDKERQLYLDALQPCTDRIDGIVRELFIQQQGSTSNMTPSGFKADAVTEDKQQEMLHTPPSCGNRQVFFSLRYLTGMEDMR